MFAATFAKEGIFHEYRKLLENFSEHVSFKKPLGGTFLRSYEAMSRLLDFPSGNILVSNLSLMAQIKDTSINNCWCNFFLIRKTLHL